MFILYSSEMVGDRINISICTDTTLFGRLLFSVHFEFRYINVSVICCL
jgi:hypothetical protein